MKVTHKKSPGLEVMKINLERMGSMKGKVGFFDSHKYPDGTSVAAVAEKNEYGAPEKGQPPRPFMRTTQESRKNDWVKWIKEQSANVALGKTSASNVLNTLVQAAAGDVRKTISDLVSPPLAESTIKARKSKLANGKTVGKLDKPLVETGVMLASVTGIVE